MSRSLQVRQHLNKADEFLAAARLGLDAGLANAAASNAVLSGINSKDAICLALTSRTSKSQNHLQAVEELRRAGRSGDRKSTRLNSSHTDISRMPSSA